MSVSVTGPQGQMDGAQSRGESSWQSRQASPRSSPAEVRGQCQHFGEDFYTSADGHRESGDSLPGGPSCVTGCLPASLN